MPFLRGDPEAFDELMSEIDPSEIPGSADWQRPSGDFEYSPAKAKFELSKLQPMSKLAADALIASGATAFRARYDGGFDEGFAHPGDVQYADGWRSFETVARNLAQPPLVKDIRDAAAKMPWFTATGDAATVTFALESLVHEVASLLLGDGFGTGEYQLYGAFTADLRTGQITDDPTATQPAGME